MKKKKLEVNLNMLSMCLFLLATLTLLVAGINVRLIHSRMQEQTKIEKNRRQCERQSQAFADASDYLTNEVWHFIATQDIDHMQNYWTEVNVTKSREKAADALIKLSLTSDEKALINAAKKESDRLIDGDAWAMRLTSDAMGLSASELPLQVARVNLSNEEKALAPEQKLELAFDYIFGEEYTASKTALSSKISQFRLTLRDRKNRELDNAGAMTCTAITTSQLFNVMMLVYVLLSVILYRTFAITPFRKYALSLKHLKEHNFVSLIPAGSRETREFASAFNEIYNDWKAQKERLEEERFRFRVAVENSHVIVYEYLPDSDVYTAYGTLNLDGIPSGGSQSNRLERTIPHFLNTYTPQFMDSSNLNIIRKLVSSNGGTARLQIMTEQGMCVWIRVTATPMPDENNRTIKIIGKIANIQSEIEKEEALEKAHSMDGLTGLYNKESGLRKIQQYMSSKSPSQICGMMILDLDNFQRINELEGGVFADAVLQDVAQILRAYTNSSDILVRLGGDEFLIFILDCPKSRATVLGPQIADAVRILTPEGVDTFSVSVSIGMCVTEVVDEFSGLYRCAESTLKYVKSHGKGHAACYLDTSNELGMMLTQVYPDRHPINTIDRPDNRSEDLISFALDLLGKSKKLSDAISFLLAKVGRQYNMDRITIIETNAEYLSCCITYQWSLQHTDNHTGETYYITRPQLQDITCSYDSDGLCDHYFSIAPFNMGSILHAAIWDHGTYSGFMSFERKKSGYSWLPEERRLLSELVRIISSFVLKAKADAVSQAKTDFLSRMSHEIRTPMNAITGMTTLAKNSLDNPEHTLNCLNKIESANAYLLNLINDILDMSRIESGKLELSMAPIKLSSQIEDIGVLIQPQADDKKLKLYIEKNFDDTLWIQADSLHLNQILINLLGNAVKFTPDGGTVTLNIEVLSHNEENTSIRFDVKDTGIGIEPEAQERIFNAFEQASSGTVSTYGGTGLGLSISTHLVQLMGGTLQVESVPKRGSDFYFILNFENVPEKDIPQEQSTVNSPDLNYSLCGKRILLVEDNSLNMEIAQEILTLNGLLVEPAANGKVALEQFQNHPCGWYDAILMDIRMPVMDGMEATRRIRTLGKDDSRSVPIIAMTANAFDEDMKKSIENGMNGHLTKPIEVDKLLSMLKRCTSTATTH